ncbi:adenine phosphoribosyltransferase [Puccinia graminis f. sp. tritici]|nr:adenine phosphoribosyltransferase [Puccinia graminis f. sp. tritici]
MLLWICNGHIKVFVFLNLAGPHFRPNPSFFVDTSIPSLKSENIHKKMADVELLKSKLGRHPDFPKKGIDFLDFLPILRDPQTFETLIGHFCHHITTTILPKLKEQGKKLDVIVGLDARGFLLGPIIALRLGCAFVPVRKAGKLPGPVEKVEYTKEYGTDTAEIQSDAIKPNQTVIVIDDLIATGGTAKAAGDLVSKLNATVLEYLFVIEIDFLEGRKTLNAPTYSIIHH